MTTRRTRRAVDRGTTDPQREAPRRGGGLRRVPDVLSRLLDPAARRRGLAETRLLIDWAAVVGPQLAARCQPVRLSHGAGGPGGVLVLHVGGAAALELQHGAPQIIERINGHFGYPAVGRLRLIQAPPRARVKLPPARPARPLSAAECARIDWLVQPISDPALRAALSRLGRTLKAAPDGHAPDRPDRPSA